MLQKSLNRGQPCETLCLAIGVHMAKLHGDPDNAVFVGYA